MHGYLCLCGGRWVWRAQGGRMVCGLWRFSYIASVSSVNMPFVALTFNQCLVLEVCPLPLPNQSKGALYG